MYYFIFSMFANIIYIKFGICISHYSPVGNLLLATYFLDNLALDSLFYAFYTSSAFSEAHNSTWHGEFK